MKYASKSLVFALFVSLFLGFAGPALAYSPTLSVNGTSITITGSQPNASVVINYTPSGSSLQTTVTGTTDFNGYFSVNVGSFPGQVSATVGGQPVDANGSSGCTYNCGSPYGLSLSQSSLYMTSGQNQSVTIYNNGAYSYNGYYASGGNTSVATASVSGNQVNVYANQSGSTTFSICQNSGSCVSLFVSVSGSACYGGNCNSGNVWFNPANPTMYSGQSLAVSINSAAYSGAYAGSGNAYYISLNSNPSAVSATVSGTVLNLYANLSGSASISVCNSGLNFCGTLYVTVNGNGCTYNCGSLSLSQTSLNLSIGQSASVSAYNNNGGTLYLSSNSNPNTVSVSISGSVINFYGIANGSSTVNVCANSSNQCASVYVSVAGGGFGNNTVTITDNIFSPKVINIPIGTTIVWTNNGSMNHTVTADDNSFTSGNLAPGQTYSHTFYAAGNFGYHCIFHGGVGGVGMSGVLIVGSGGGSAVWFSQNTVNLNIGQNQSVTIYSNNYSGNYYISSNPNSGMVSVNVIGNALNLNGLMLGSSTVTVCQSSGSSQCGSVYVTVGGGGSGGNLSLSQNNLSLNVGQSSSVNIYGNGSYYISSNSNSAVASATLSGSALNVYGGSNGSSNIQICQNSGSCVTLYVRVGGTAYGSLTFTTASLPTMTLGQYYSYQLQASRGTPPYNFTLSGGNLPNGLSLSPSGLISGTPNSSSAVSFTVRVSDNFGHSGSANFAIGGSVLGVSTYANGQLINENGTVYIVYKNMRTGFANAAAFLGLGFKFGNVIAVSNSGLSDSGYTVTTARSQHPWGSWIKSGRTIYFVHDSGLIPVPDWNTFLNNGGQAGLIVPANTWDFHMLILSPMVWSDPRLQ